MRWTEEQNDIIAYDQPADLLVSAAAGSGKTAVLTERIVRRALQDKIRLPHLLVMTFTDLAAKQMKQRIATRFRESRESGAKTRLRELPLAQISTIHAFCNQVLSSHLDRFAGKDGTPYLEPGYRIADESLASSLLEESTDTVISVLNTGLDAVLRETAPNPSEPVAQGLPDEGAPPAPFTLSGEARALDAWYRDYRALSLAFAPHLSDAPFREAIASMLRHLHHLPHYATRVAQALEHQFDGADTFPSGDLADFWWERFEKALDCARKALLELRETDIYASFREAKTNPVQNLKRATETMERVVRQLSGPHERTAKRWDDVVRAGECVDDLSFPSYLKDSKNEAIQARNRYLDRFFQDVLPLAGLITERAPRTERLAPYLEEFPPVFTLPSEALRRDLLTSARVTARFIEVVLLVDAEFRRRRFSENIILFSDIEHGALALLEQKDIGERYRTYFDEIYVDEYQDTSSIQNAILRAVARDNVFMVGDVKQSIYRFRYANPALFTDLADASTRLAHGENDDVKPSSGRLALLSQNFRSRPAVLAFINDFFSAFMTRESGDIEYDETQAMTPGRPASENPLPAVVLSVACMTDETKDEGADPNDEKDDVNAPNPTLSPTEQEAVMAADIIQDLLSGGAAPESIAVLLPTNDNCRVYSDVLKSLHIPVVTRTGPVFPDNPVTRQVEVLLELLDNPLQDIPLINTLMGPFPTDPFTEEELVAIAGTAAPDESDPPDERTAELFKTIDEESTFAERAEREKKRSFHRRFFAAAEGNASIAQSLDPALRRKITRFAETLARWRLLAQELPARELIDILFAETDYETTAAESPQSEHYAADLDTLKDILEGEPGAPLPDLRQALELIRKAREETRLVPSSESALLPGAVHVLTRHSSKGLQWDHVILGGLFRPYERRDAHDLITFSEKQGLSACTVADGGLSLYNNPLHERAVFLNRREDQKESWRLLYVCMTRARERLFLLFPAKKTIGDIKRVRALVDRVHAASRAMTDDARRQHGALPTALSTAAQSDAELILAVLALRAPDRLEEMITSDGTANTPEGEPASPDTASEKPTSATFAFPYAIAGVERWHAVDRRVRERAAAAPPEPSDVGASIARPRRPSDLSDAEKAYFDLLLAEIPRKDAADTPAKVSVTEIKRLREEQDLSIAAEGAYVDTPAPYRADLFERDRQKTGGTVPALDLALTMRRREGEDFTKGTALGILLHTVFQFLDIAPLRAASDRDGKALYLEQIAALRDRSVFTAEQHDAVTPFYNEALLWAKSDLAGRLLAVEKTSGRVYREMPFTLAVPSNTLHPRYPGDEKTLVQGMIDLWFVEENGDAILVDFKSDRLPAQNVRDFFEARYAFQLQTYAGAIARATGRTVRERVIWLIRAGYGIAL